MIFKIYYSEMIEYSEGVEANSIGEASEKFISKLLKEEYTPTDKDVINYSIRGGGVTHEPSTYRHGGTHNNKDRDPVQQDSTNHNS